MKKPSFLMVLTAVGQYAYKRPKDGVLVVPIRYGLVEVCFEFHVNNC